MKRLILHAVFTVQLVSVWAAAPADPRATVAQGPLVGAMDNGVAVFRGVPFAAPPVGDLR